MNNVHLLNLAFVGAFGMILSIAFCDIAWSPQKRKILLGSLTVIVMLQGSVCFFASLSLVEYFYPVITHIPLAVTLCVLSRKYLWSVISVLAAYFCCQIRRWLALLITALFAGSMTMQDITEMVITLPLLIFLVRSVAPSVRFVSHDTIPSQCQFGLVPMVYYGYDYLTRIYTNLLSEGALVVVEFMSFVCCVAYLFFVLHISAAEQMRGQLENARENLNAQVAQAVREIESLREAQQKARAYRHDLRHHMQYLSSCIANGKTEQAQAYIQEVYSEIKADQLITFCENEAANLIFSAFDDRAKKHGIPIKIQAVVSQMLSVSESDLCVLLSNALENALHACQKLKKAGDECMIDVLSYEKDKKFFLQIINSCCEDIVFVGGIPVTDRLGHGIGMSSICAIVEKYGGIYSFSVKDRKFILRVFL